MQVAMIGLGRMGSNMVRRLMRSGHECVVYDRNSGSAAPLKDDGADSASSFEELAARLRPPRVVWMMVPAGVVGDVLAELVENLDAGDVVVDGGNSHFVDDLVRARDVADRGIHYVDCGVSGGVWGLENGYALMAGGEDEAVEIVAPLLRSLAPGVDAAPRTPGREGPPAPEEEGWLHCGPPGSGHFVKMVHNGIEYGLMESYAEGLSVLRHANAGSAELEHDAETAPMSDPARYRYEIDVAKVAELWRRGTVVRSWLLDLAAAALHDDPGLEGFSGSVSDSGEGRWTAQAAIETGTPAPVLTAALFARFSSRGEDLHANRLLSAMRAQFGGHAERLAERASGEHRSPGAKGGTG
jgi:6-phosphogluconate dehydrogenase